MATKSLIYLRSAELMNLLSHRKLVLQHYCKTSYAFFVTRFTLPLHGRAAEHTRVHGALITFCASNQNTHYQKFDKLKFMQHQAWEQICS